MRTHRVSFTIAELEHEQVRVPVRSSNTLVSLGTFEEVDLETGRGRYTGRGPAAEIRARSGRRVATLSARYFVGDHLAVAIMHTRKSRQVFRVVQVQGKRVKDWVTVGDLQFKPEAWVARHGRALYDANVWCWCLTVKTVRP